MAKTLYICYFGMREPLVQTQVLPYLREIRKDGIDISILTFEPGDIRAEIGEAGIAEIRERLAAEGIKWHWLPYHKRFSVLATAWDIFRGVLFIRGFIKRERPDVLHGRVHVPTLMGALARKFSRHKPKLLFDIRGFLPEEYVDAGVWANGGVLFRVAKRIEKWLLSESDGIVVLTSAARSIMFPEIRTNVAEGGASGKTWVEVIPCCVDLTRFDQSAIPSRESVRARLGAGSDLILTYVGSFGGWYLSEDMIEFFATVHRTIPNSFFVILTQRDLGKVTERLVEAGIPERRYFVGSASPKEVGHYLNAADISVSFIKPTFSKKSSSPTKLAEYLISGLPVISNRGVGDVDEIISGNGVGAILDDLAPVSYRRALEKVLSMGDVREHCRSVARAEFDLENVGGYRYRRLYNRLLRPASHKDHP